jgi:hypothetical protein
VPGAAERPSVSFPNVIAYPARRQIDWEAQMKRGAIRTMSAAAVCAVAVAGCGGGGSSGLSQKDLAAKTESVCSSSSKKITAIQQPSDFTTNPQAAAAYLDKVLAVYKDAADKLKALKPADSVKSQWNGITGQLDKLITLIDDIDKKAHNKDRSGIAELQQVGPLTTSLNNATKAIGANCATA